MGESSERMRRSTASKNNGRVGIVTAKEVAKVIGVSQSTVSRAFTENASISPRMRAQVMAAAERLGYTPNVIARSLITRRTNIVGIVMADLTNPFYPEVLEQLAKKLQQTGRQTLLFNVPPGKEVDDELPLVLQYQVDAVVITSANVSSAMARACSERGTMVVLLNRYVPGAPVHAISCDNYAGGRAVAEFLVKQGHVRPAYVAGKPDTTTNLDRERGFVEGLAALGVPLWARDGGEDYTYETGAEAALRLVDGRRLPDAIFFANDIMALGGLDAIRDKTKLRIPEDLSIVGFDDIQMAAWPSYGLTTVRQPIAAMVEKTAELLRLSVSGRLPKPRPHFIAGSLIERTSTTRRRRR